MLVCESLLKHKPSDIARFFRTHMKRKGWKRFNGVAAKDPHYQAILQRILRVKKAKYQVNMDHVLNSNEGGMDKKENMARTKDLKSNSVKTNACGRHILNQDHGV